MDQNLNREWMEAVLAEHLRPVGAPAELWSRIQRRDRPVQARGIGLRIGWVTAVAALLVAGASAFLGVHGASRGMSLQSSSASEIQAWVKDNAGLDVPFPAQVAGGVRLNGARLGANGVEVDYFVRNRPERLLIARADAGSPLEHRFTGLGSRKVSWTMGGQSYAVECATPEDAEAACLLCHAGA